jgi:choline monooxygenase
MTHPELERFDATAPIERARTPPAAWYHDPAFFALERRTVFARTWQCIGPLEPLAAPGSFVSGEIAGEPFVAVRGADGELRAFSNVCRHHASALVRGAGRLERFVCPYHGWTYDLDGRLRKAPRTAGLAGFARESFGLVAQEVGQWGPLAFVRIAPGSGEGLAELLAPLAGRLDASSLSFVARRSYELACNWKVFVDNYLDGGYHVAQLHGGLAAQLDLESYRTEVAYKVSLQICSSGSGAGGAGGVDFGERLGRGAVYAFVYPNFMINRYGPIMDTNWVLPLGPERTLTIFDYYFEPAAAADASFVERSLAASDRVQLEDVEICESVQRGLRSAAYDTGVYAPALEQAALHFHRQLAADLRS